MTKLDYLTTLFSVNVLSLTPKSCFENCKFQFYVLFMVSKKHWIIHPKVNLFILKPNIPYQRMQSQPSMTWIFVVLGGNLKFWPPIHKADILLADTSFQWPTCPLCRLTLKDERELDNRLVVRAILGSIRSLILLVWHDRVVLDKRPSQIFTKTNARP